MVVSVAVAV